MEKKATKKQHYVPQFYLRQWCEDDGGFYPIKIESKIPPKLNIFEDKSSPSRFCFENFFYAQHTGKEDKMSQDLEKTFAEAEAIFSSELPKLENKILNNEQITEQDKYNLSQCMIFLHFRGRKYLDQSKKMSESLFKQVNKMSIPFIDRNPKTKAKMEELGITKEEMIDFVNKENYSVDFGNAHHLLIMKDMVGFSNLLYAKYWMAFISRKGEFITTDAPYLDRAMSSEFWGNDFLSREQSFILSPKVVIIALYPKNKSGKKFKRKDITNEKGKIQTINSINLMNSITFGFHKDRELLIELEKLTQKFYLYYNLKEKYKKEP